MTHADIIVRLIPMAPSVHGAHTVNEDGCITVFLNANDTAERRLLAYRHELDHVEHDDMAKKDAAVENRAHRKNG